MRFRWVAESIEDATTQGLLWRPVLRSSAYDRHAAEVDMSLPLEASQAEPEIGADFTGGIAALRAARRARRFGIIKLLSETQEALLQIDTTDEMLFIARQDIWPDATRRALWQRTARVMAARISGIQQDAPSLGTSPGKTAQGVVPASVWSITPKEILDEIQYHMLEPVIDGGLTWQFRPSGEVLRYLRERVSQFLNATDLIKTRGTILLTAGQAEYDLDPTLAALQRVYKDGSLSRETAWSLDKWQPTWENDQAGAPHSFVESTNRKVRLVPAPSTGGSASYVYVSTTPTEGGGAFLFQALRIPATFAWGIKYGVMADMLRREGEGNDPARAAYCETRFQDSVALARMLMGAKVEPTGGSNK